MTLHGLTQGRMDPSKVTPMEGVEALDLLLEKILSEVALASKLNMREGVKSSSNSKQDPNRRDSDILITKQAMARSTTHTQVIEARTLSTIFSKSSRRCSASNKWNKSASGVSRDSDNSKIGISTIVIDRSMNNKIRITDNLLRRKRREMKISLKNRGSNGKGKGLD